MVTYTDEHGDCTGRMDVRGTGMRRPVRDAGRPGSV